MTRVLTLVVILVMQVASYAQTLRVTNAREECVDGRYCRRVRDCGSGVVVASDGQTTYAVTAAHVVKHAGDLRVQETIRARVVARDAMNDIALIVIEGRYEDGVAVLRDAAAGDAVGLCGYGGGTYQRIDGTLVDERWITATSRHGDSGGPVYCTRTYGLVGIAIALDKSGHTLIVPSSTLRTFISTNCPMKIRVVKADEPRVTSGLESRVAALEARIRQLQECREIPGPPGKDGKDGVTGPLTITLNTLNDEGQVVSTTTKTYKVGEPVILNFRPIESNRK